MFICLLFSDMQAGRINMARKKKIFDTSTWSTLSRLESHIKTQCFNVSDLQLQTMAGLLVLLGVLCALLYKYGLPSAGTELTSALEYGSKPDWHLQHGYNTTTEQANKAISKFLENYGCWAYDFYSYPPTSSPTLSSPTSPPAQSPRRLGEKPSRPVSFLSKETK